MTNTTLRAIKEIVLLLIPRITTDVIAVVAESRDHVRPVDLLEWVGDQYYDHVVKVRVFTWLNRAYPLEKGRCYTKKEWEAIGEE